MRLILFILFLILGQLGSAQRYSKAIEDTAIVNFMTWLFSSDTSVKARKQVDNHILKPDVINFAYADSGSLNYYQFARNIFQKRNGLRTYFTETDANTFVNQVKGQRKFRWNLKSKQIRFVNTVELINNRLEKVLYSYSLPLFSADRKYVIIIEAYYCGLVCGGGEYCLYERQSNGTWRKLTQFNQWEE